MVLELSRKVKLLNDIPYFRQAYVQAFRPILLAAVPATLVLFSAFPLTAHHSTAPFDMTNLSTRVQGTVIEFLWSNPHSYIVLDEKAPGKTHRWKLEAEALNLLRRNGWTKTSLKPGDEITCIGARAKNPQSHTMKCFAVEFPDGRRLEATPMGVSGKQPRDLR